ncbi:[4Fe-4S] proteins maturation [Rhizina undulata]
MSTSTLPRLCFRLLTSSTQAPPRPLRLPRRLPKLALQRPQFRFQFSTSCLRPYPPTITNPRTDDDGNPMLIEISPRAANRLLEIQKKDSNPALALRITVESGGCHGFQYLMSLSDKFDAEEDTMFDVDGAKVVLDETSLELLKGSRVDYTMELIGSQFKIVDNPHATSSCGCGTSFDIKP